MDDLKKDSSTGMEDETTHDPLFNLKRLKDGYGSIVEKMGYAKFNPYLQRLFHSIELMLAHEVTEFKKIDAKYQDMVRQCHIYEKTLTLLKESNCCELSSFSESSNTYAFEDLTKVTPYLAPDLLQSTLGVANGGSTSIQFRLPRRRSSLSSQQFVSTPLGPLRATKPAVPIAKFDEDPSFVLTQSLGFPQQEKQFTDAWTEPEPERVIEHSDFSCQVIPLSADKEIETIQFTFDIQSTQTDDLPTEDAACQINPSNQDGSMQTSVNEQRDFSCQIIPVAIDQTTETVKTDVQTQLIQTDAIATNDCSSQIMPDYLDQHTETIRILTEDIALQSSLNNSISFDDQQIQTDCISHTDASTQYELEAETPDTVILPILFSEDVPVSNEIEIFVQTDEIQDRSLEVEQIILIEQGTQTLVHVFEQSNECTQTPHVLLNDCGSQSSTISHENQLIQTDPYSHVYSSSLFIVPTSQDQSWCSSTIVMMPRDTSSSTLSLCHQESQCDLQDTPTAIPIGIDHRAQTNDRRSMIQQQMDEKEKQMNRIIEEYAALYGEYETERRRNMDLTEARDRLADHIKILSDELGDREINQEKLLIKSCQQNKLINYMLPQIECSPMLKKKHHSASSFRRLLPKFK